MFKSTIYLLFSFLLILPLAGYSQDLGSSNGLFRSPNPSSKSSSSEKKTTSTKPKTTSTAKTAKSTPAKKETSAKREPAKRDSASNKSSSKSPAKSNSSSAKTAKSRTQVAKTEETVETAKPRPVTTPNTDIIINVGQPTSGGFDEFYEKAIDEGNNARDERNYLQAESAYRRAQNLKPSDSRAIYGLGNIYSDQQRWEEAEKFYRQAIQLEPNSPEPYIALSFVLTQPVIGRDLTDRYNEAEKMARRAITFDSSNAVAFDQLGVALELQGIIGQETQDAYRKAIQLDPNFALAYAHLGRLLRRTGMINESSKAYNDAIRLASDVPTMILVAEVMQSQQRFVESEQLLRRALREDPKNPTALFLLGRALTTRGSFAEAEKVLKTSVQVSPNNFVAYALLASLYARQNNFEEAEKILMQAIKVVSVNEKRRLSQEFELVGDSLAKAGRPKDAARLYRQALALDGNKLLLTTKLNKAQKS